MINNIPIPTVPQNGTVGNADEIREVFIDLAEKENEIIADVNNNSNIIADINSRFIRYNSTFTRIGISQAIASSSTYNLVDALVGGNPPTYYNVPATRTDKTILSTVATKNVFKVQEFTRYIDYLVAIRLTGSFSGNSTSARELIFNVRRASDDSLVFTKTVFSNQASNLQSFQIDLNTRTLGAGDPFSSSGFYVELLNNSGQTYTLTALTIFISGA